MRTLVTERPEIPWGLCQCGCGKRTPIAKRNRSERGIRKGEPTEFLMGHRSRSLASYEIDDETGCWVWARTFLPNGYGIWGNGYAHRKMYERHVGPIPDGLDLDHLCRNRGCVNPAHLEPVTRAENLRRGRGTLLTAEQVREIRVADGTLAEIGAAFGVSTSCVDAIRRRVNWKDVV